MLPDYAEFEEAIGLDWYALDPNLSFLLDRTISDPAERELAEDVAAEFGDLVGRRVAARAEVSGRHPPVLERYDRWGRDVGRVVHHPSWLENKADLVRAGFAGGLEGRLGSPVSPVVKAATSYLVSQADTALYCALGMTAGAAEVVERFAPPVVREEFVRRLRSLDPAEAWEGGMFLTERQGGSDVGANTTRAMRDGDTWRLVGEKHFCSNVDADVFIVLARPEGAPEGTAGLGTFIVPRRIGGAPNGFTVKRLKPKLGTRAVPTAEVSLDGALGYLADDGVEGGGRVGRGLAPMMEMVNESRFGVAIMSLGIHRRSFLEAAIYAARRRQFGRRIDSFPLVRETLVDLLSDLEAGLALSFECAAIRDTAPAEEAAAFTRIAIPLAKVRACRVGLESATQALEVLGGNGYMEDWPLARQVRDAQCNTIWEGTENVCLLDVRRAMHSAAGHEAVVRRIDRALETALPAAPLVGEALDLVASAREDAAAAARSLLASPEEGALLALRRLAYLLADTLEGALLCEEAGCAVTSSGNARKAVVAAHFIRRRLGPARPLEGDSSVLALFEPIVRYGEAEPASRS